MKLTLERIRNMKIGVAGAGAVGCVFGGYLSKAGYDVTFMARGNHLKSMKKHGLIVEAAEGTYKVSESFTEDASGLCDVDVVLFCFKSNDTEKMAKELKRVIKSEAVILTLQNGVDNEEVLSKMFGEERVISAAAYVQAMISSPGHVRQVGSISLVMGELHDKSNNICSQVAKMFRQPELDVEHVDNIMERKWKKLLWNVTFNPISAALQVRVGEVLDNEELNDIASRICEESINVAKRIGIPLDIEKTVSTIFHNATYAKDHQTSMLQDRMSNKKMEVDSMCGYIVKKGEEYSVPTPTLNTIYNMLTFLNRGDSKKDILI